MNVFQDFLKNSREGDGRQGFPQTSMALEPLLKLSVSHLDRLTLREPSGLSSQEVAGPGFYVWRRSFQQTRLALLLTVFCCSRGVGIKT